MKTKRPKFDLRRLPGLGALVCLLGVCAPARATVWYLDNAATGANTGTSWANAWSSPASVVWGGSGVRAGDTLYISGGTSSKTYIGKLSVGASGSGPSARITVRIGQDAGHNGLAIFTGGIGANSTSYVTVDGEVAGARRLRAVGGATAESANHFVFRYLEAETAAIGIAARYGVGGVIDSCYVRDVTEEVGIGLAARNTGVAAYDQTLITNTIICLNRLGTGSGNGPDGIQGCRGLTVDRCTFSNVVGTVTGAQHQDYIQMQANYIKVRNSRFIGSADSCIDYDTFNGQPENHQIYNNTFILIRGSGIRYYNSGGEPFTSVNNVLIANNTIVDHTSGHQWGISFQFFTGANPSVSNTRIQNNLFYNHTTQPIHIEASTAATAADWNVDYNLANGGVTTLLVGGVNYTQAHPFTSAPAFAQYTAGSEGSYLRLAAGDVAAKDKGVNLAADFLTDAESYARGQGAGWDIGAYEIGSGNAAVTVLSYEVTVGVTNGTAGTNSGGYINLIRR